LERRRHYGDSHTILFYLWAEPKLAVYLGNILNNKWSYSC